MILSDAHVLQAGNNQELFSNSNCALTDDPFQFDLWTITKTSPGKSNEVECVGGVDENMIQQCDAAISSDSGVSVQDVDVSTINRNDDLNINSQVNVDSDVQMQETDASHCANEVGDQINSMHKEKLQSIYSKELKVSGNDERVTGTYIMTEEVLGFREAYKRQTDDDVSSVDTFYIFYLPDHSGWRLGNKQSYWQSGNAPGGYFYSSKFLRTVPIGQKKSYDQLNNNNKHA